MSRSARLTALLALFALVALACGQKPGVHAEGVALGEAPSSATGVPGTGTDTTGLDGSATPSPGTDTGIPGAPVPGGPGDGSDVPGDVPGAPTDPADPADPDDPEAPAAPVGSDRTGITEKTITIGLHAPVTGAAPIRTDSFLTGKDLFWDHGNNGKPIEVFGRQVEVLFRDDKYNPSTATSVCQEMAEGEDAFLLIGGGGTDQIAACARYASTKGIPYLSAGVVEDDLRPLRNYFALSMTYAQQIPLLAQYVKSVLKHTDNSRVVMIAPNTANFDDAVSAFESSFPGAALLRPSKSASGSEYADEICSGPSKNYDIVFPIGPPTFFLELEGSAACNPQYVGVGITSGLNTVASTGCRSATGSMNGSRFFSPFFAYKDTTTKAKDFRAAGGRDDIQFAIWGLMKVIHQLLLEAGEDITREGFIAATENAQGIASGVFPELNYAPDDHFGSTGVHVLKAVCSGSGGEYVTERYFASSF